MTAAMTVDGLHKQDNTKAAKAQTANYKTMKLAPEHLRPSTPEDSTRSSFSSVRENDSDFAQAFTSSKTSSYSVAHHEEAIDDASSVDMTEVEYLPPITNPHSKLHGNFFPANGFKGWKQINVRGKLASRSFGDLQSLHLVWSSPSTPVKKEKSKPKPGSAPIERLPVEILSSIIELLLLDIPNGITARNVDLMSLLLASRSLHTATLSTLYRNITVPHSRIFRKFLTHVATYPALGTIVRRIDFSHFNPATLFSTESERAAAQNLTSKTLLECLELTPYLQEFLAQEHVAQDLSGPVLRKLLLDMPRLQAVDLCGCSSKAFKESFESVLLSPWPESLSISRLSLHKCLSLPPSVFETLLPRMPRLTHLDVAGTRITDAALASIPHTARLTHLNLAKCSLLSADAVVEFLSYHPAARGLVFLSVATDVRFNQLFDAADLRRLLPALPATLRSLSLRGAKMDDPKTLVDLLRPLSKHLEELAVGRCLTAADLNRLFMPDEDAQTAADEDDEDEDTMQLDGADDAWTPPALRYLDVSDLTVQELDLSGLFDTRSSAVLTPRRRRRTRGAARAPHHPLEVLEVSDEAYGRLSRSEAALRSVGWRATEFGSRSWLVKAVSQGPSPRADDGRRAWKWGAAYWGMRKVPVARADVGGMYGSFMFSRKL